MNYAEIKTYAYALKQMGKKLKSIRCRRIFHEIVCTNLNGLYVYSTYIDISSKLKFIKPDGQQNYLPRWVYFLIRR